MKINSKRGSAAAGLIGIITLMLVFYILFLPAEERAELLDSDSYDYDDDYDDYDDILLDEAPGRIDYTDKGVFDHHISNIFLVARSNAAVLATENPFVVRKGWTSERTKVMIFTINNLQNTENVLLSFQSLERRGNLVIKVNGNLVYENKVPIQNPPPVVLPVAFLNPSNVIEFSVNGGFFETKRYSLTDVKIVGDVIDAKRQTASTTFTVSNTEIDNLDYAYLDFYPLCNQREIGVLTLSLNNRIIYSAVPACDSLNRQDLFAEDLRDGRNTITFTIDKGSYRVEQVRVRTLLDEVETFVDYFDVTSILYNDILDEDREIILKIEFVDDESIKRAELNINKRKDIIDQREDEYEIDISDWIKEGNNFIELKPLTELDIVNIEIRVD